MPCRPFAWIGNILGCTTRSSTDCNRKRLKKIQPFAPLPDPSHKHGQIHARPHTHNPRRKSPPPPYVANLDPYYVNQRRGYRHPRQHSGAARRHHTVTDVHLRPPMLSPHQAHGTSARPRTHGHAQENHQRYSANHTHLRPMPNADRFGRDVYTSLPYGTFQAPHSDRHTPRPTTTDPTWPHIRHGQSTLTPGQELFLTSGTFPSPGSEAFARGFPWPPHDFQYVTQLAPWLIPNHADVDRPTLHWDVTLPLSTAYRVNSQNTLVPLDRTVLGADAAWPRADQVDVIVHNDLVRHAWRPIRVRSRGGARTQASVGDVLQSIHDFFQLSMTVYEYDALVRAYPDAAREVRRGRDKRVRQMTERGFVGNQAGLVRGDVLGRRTCWWGMWVVYDSGRWSVHLGLVPR